MRKVQNKLPSCMDSAIKTHGRKVGTIPVMATPARRGNKQTNRGFLGL